MGGLYNFLTVDFITNLIRPPDIIVGGLIFYQGFFVVVFLFAL